MNDARCKIESEKHQIETKNYGIFYCKKCGAIWYNEAEWDYQVNCTGLWAITSYMPPVMPNIRVRV